MEEGNQDKENINQLKIKGIPIIAIIFPPIGIMMLVKYLLKKNRKGDKNG